MPLALDRLVITLQRTVGALPSVLVFGGALAATLAAGLLGGDDAAEIAALATFVLWVVYCVARPGDRLAVFGIAAAPSAASVIPADLFDISRLWIALPLLPIALAFLFEQDRRARRGDPGGGVSSAEPPAP